MTKNNENRKPDEMHRERDLGQYETVLLGIDKFLQYIQKRNPQSSLLLDVGTGSGKAANQLQANHKKINVIGIDPVKHPKVDKNLPGKFLQRGAENIPEIAEKTVDGMLLVHSIAYADKKSIKKIAQELSRVCKDGAILKGSALHPLAQASKGLKLTSIEISDALNEAGFISVCASDYGKDAGQGEDIFMAIKRTDDMDEYDTEYLLQQMIREN